MPKPSDFYVSVIEFFGILVPGALLTFLHRDSLARAFGVEPASTTTVAWAAFLVAAYIAGQLLLGAGIPLNWLLKLTEPESTDTFFQAAQQHIDIIRGVRNTRTNAFYQAYAELRLRSTEALAEIERNMADYKLFRSLTLVFMLQFVVAIAQATSWRELKVWLLLVLLLLAIGRFLFLLGWTYRTAFEYLVLIKTDKEISTKTLH